MGEPAPSLLQQIDLNGSKRDLKCRPSISGSSALYKINNDVIEDTVHWPGLHYIGSTLHESLQYGTSSTQFRNPTLTYFRNNTWFATLSALLCITL